eukprot:10915299-Ditylum_brightwellii.AAC.1
MRYKGRAVINKKSTAMELVRFFLFSKSMGERTRKTGFILIAKNNRAWSSVTKFEHTLKEDILRGMIALNR